MDGARFQDHPENDLGCGRVSKGATSWIAISAVTALALSVLFGLRITRQGLLRSKSLGAE